MVGNRLPTPGIQGKFRLRIIVRKEEREPENKNGQCECHVLHQGASQGNGARSRV